MNTTLPLVIFGDHDEKVIEQLERCTEAGVKGVLCADGHLGYSQPIGGAVAYQDHISPSGVGYDIGCGNKAIETPLLYEDIRADIPAIVDEIATRIAFGMGRPNDEPVDHEVFDRINNDYPIHDHRRKLLATAKVQLGTVGGGNHYVDIFREDETDRVWIGVHFGSRGFGHKTATGFLWLAKNRPFDSGAYKDDMHAKPVLLDTRNPLGAAYAEAMTIAGEYAYAGRDVVCEKVLGILGTEEIDSVHNHHNYAWLEEHDGTEVWVVRKGCTPAFPGQRGFVGGSMGEISVVLEGTDTGVNRDAMYSTVHGAGRAMSRTEAKGKVRRRKRYRNNLRDDDTLYQSEAEALAIEGATSAKKTWVEERKTEGKINWAEVQAGLAKRGIEIRGGAADEAPEAYKRLPEVLMCHAEAINVLKTLHPVGVVMAGPDIPADD